MTDMIRSLAALLRPEPAVAEGDRPPSDQGDGGFSTEPDDMTTMPDIGPDTAAPPLQVDPLRTWLEDLAGISAELAASEPQPVTDAGPARAAVAHDGLTDSTAPDAAATQAAGDMVPLGAGVAPLADAVASEGDSRPRVPQPLPGQSAQTAQAVAAASQAQDSGMGTVAVPEPTGDLPAAIPADPAQQADRGVADGPEATARESLTRADAPPAQDLRRRTGGAAGGPTSAAPARLPAEAGAGAPPPAPAGAQAGAQAATTAATGGAATGGAAPQRVAAMAMDQAAATPHDDADQPVADRRQAGAGKARHPAVGVLRDAATPAPGSDAGTPAEPSGRMSGRQDADEPVDARKAPAPTPLSPDAAPDRIARAASVPGLMAPDPPPAEPLRADDAFAPGIRPAGPVTALTRHSDAGRPDAVAPLLRQISGALVTTRGGVTEIALAPEELGRLHLVLTGQDRPHLVLWAERPETLDMLRRNVDLLTAELQEAGVEAGLLDFRDGPPPDMPDQMRQDTPSAGQDSPETLTMAAALSTALAVETGRLASARRIDVRL